ETLLYMAARAQLVKEVIRPSLEKGLIILCDRFLDSTIAYQGYGNGVDISIIKEIGDFATRKIKPDLTVLFDIDTKLGLSRTSRHKDRIELRAIAYHKKVRAGYLAIARKEPRRMKVIKVNKGVNAVHQEVCGEINRLLGIK
ncbi:MAG: dTMP kinase, partial [Candidatus Omnitrophica bacterium]|nr:dTMP kinase [Candidatus Omnitrophota bacterium]